MTRPTVLLLDDPTRGIDVGDKAELYRIMDELCRSGMGILFTTSELPELVAVCDRILVLAEGHAVGEVPAPKPPSSGSWSWPRNVQAMSERRVGQDREPSEGRLGCAEFERVFVMVEFRFCSSVQPISLVVLHMLRTPAGLSRW